MFHFRLEVCCKRRHWEGLTRENRIQFLEGERPGNGCLSRETRCPNRQVCKCSNKKFTQCTGIKFLCLPGSVRGSGIQAGHRPGRLRSQALESTTPGPTLAPFSISVKPRTSFFYQHPFSTPLVTIPLLLSGEPSLWFTLSQRS